MRCFIFFVLPIVLLSQNEFFIITDTDTLKNSRYEIALISDIFKLMEKRENNKFDIRWVRDIQSFRDGFDKLNQIAKDKPNQVLYINNVSITDERKVNYDFSVPYIKNFHSILSLKQSQLSEKDIEKKNMRFGVIKGSLGAELFNKRFPSKLIKEYDNSKSIALALEKKQIDFAVSDFLDSWDYNLKVVSSIHEKEDLIGIMLPKGSTFTAKLNQIMDYYLKSPSHYNLVKTILGEEALPFFRK